MRRFLAILAGLIASYIGAFLASFLVSFLVAAAGSEYQATAAIRTVYEVVAVVFAILVAFWVDGSGKAGDRKTTPVANAQMSETEISRRPPTGLT